jgi:hypothetical protein
VLVILGGAETLDAVGNMLKNIKCKVAIAPLCIVRIMFEGSAVPVVKMRHFALFLHEFSNNDNAMELGK